MISIKFADECLLIPLELEAKETTGKLHIIIKPSFKSLIIPYIFYIMVLGHVQSVFYLDN